MPPACLRPGSCRVPCWTRLSCVPRWCRPLATKVLCDRLAGPAPAALPTVAGRLAAQIERARPRPLILAGHSAGGVVAVLVTLQVPGRVYALLVASTRAHMQGQRDGDMPDRIRDESGPVAGFVDRCHDRPLPPGPGTSWSGMPCTAIRSATATPSSASGVSTCARNWAGYGTLPSWPTGGWTGSGCCPTRTNSPTASPAAS